MIISRKCKLRNPSIEILNEASVLLSCWGIKADRNDPHPSKSWKRREEEAFSQPQQQGCTTFDQVGHHLNHDNLSGHHPDLDADFEWSQSKLGGYDSPGTASLASTTNLDNTDNYQNLRQLHQQATTTVSSILQSQSQSQSPPSHLHNDILQADQTAGSSTWVTRYFVSSD